MRRTGYGQELSQPLSKSKYDCLYDCQILPRARRCLLPLHGVDSAAPSPLIINPGLGLNPFAIRMLHFLNLAHRIRQLDHLRVGVPSR